MIGEAPVLQIGDTVACQQCGRRVRVKPSRARRLRFCSMACRAAAQRLDTPVGFWARVDRSPGPAGCWPWRGRRLDGPHVSIPWGARAALGAHVVAFILTYGHVLPGVVIRHRCDHPPCCNPRHLTVGTKADNIRDAQQRGRLCTGATHWTHRQPERLARGERAAHAKLTAAQVTMIRTAYAAGGGSLNALALQYGVSKKTVLNIVHRRVWRQVA
jgi:hypothetical protein